MHDAARKKKTANGRSRAHATAPADGTTSLATRHASIPSFSSLVESLPFILFFARKQALALSRHGLHLFCLRSLVPLDSANFHILPSFG